MFKNLKKKLLVASAVVLIATSIPAKASVIHDNRTSEVIATGVTHVTIDRFTKNGFVDIQVLKLDTNNKFSGLAPLISDRGTSNRATLSSMIAAEDKIVAGVNGDFFTYTRYPMALGSLYADDQLVLTTPEAAYARNNLYIRKDGTSGVGNIPNDIRVQDISRGKTININALNKVSAPYRATSMLDHNWGIKSPGKSLGANVTEVLITDNKVVDTRTNGDGFPIKKGSYVLTQVGDDLKDFKPGDTVNLNLGAYNNLKFSVGGGNILVKDSKVQEKGLNKSRAPRTAIGINRSGSEVLMVTVDGRNGKSIGMTELELAQFMQSIGCKDAINLDGGGSTTMATKKSKEDVKVTNDPSDKAERAVANGIGIKSDAPVSEPSYIKLETNTTEVFPGFSYKFSAGVYDKYHNKLDVPASDLNITLNGEPITGDHFAPTAKGPQKLVAKLGNAEGELELIGRSPLVELFADVDQIRLDYGESITLKDFYGLDDEGYKKTIGDSMINISTVGDIGSINGTTLTAGDQQTSGAVVLKFGNATKYIPVAVGHERSEVTQITTEDVHVSTLPEDPTIVVGRSEESDAGAKISFSVLWHKDHRNILADLKEPIDLGDSDGLQVSVTGPNAPIRLQAVLTDQSGEEKIITVSDKLSFADTKDLTADLPAGHWSLKGFRLNVDHNKDYKGEIVIDNISTIKYTPMDTSMTEESTRVVDPINYSIEGANKITIGAAENSSIASHMNNSQVAVSYSGKGLSNVSAATKIDGNGKYNVKRTNNTVFVTLENNGKSLRATNQNQWSKFISEVENSAEKNFVIISHKDPLNMTGNKEKALFEDMLQKLVNKDKNVFLVVDGSSTDVELIDGYRKVTVNPTGADNKTLDIFVNGDQISYTINNL